MGASPVETHGRASLQTESKTESKTESQTEQQTKQQTEQQQDNNRTTNRFRILTTNQTTNQTTNRNSPDRYVTSTILWKNSKTNTAQHRTECPIGIIRVMDIILLPW